MKVDIEALPVNGCPSIQVQLGEINFFPDVHTCTAAIPFVEFRYFTKASCSFLLQMTGRIDSCLTHSCNAVYHCVSSIFTLKQETLLLSLVMQISLVNDSSLMTVNAVRQVKNTYFLTEIRIFYSTIKYAGTVSIVCIHTHTSTDLHIPVSESQIHTPISNILQVSDFTSAEISTMQSNTSH